MEYRISKEGLKIVNYNNTLYLRGVERLFSEEDRKEYYPWIRNGNYPPHSLYWNEYQHSLGQLSKPVGAGCGVSGFLGSAYGLLSVPPAIIRMPEFKEEFERTILGGEKLLHHGSLIMCVTDSSLDVSQKTLEAMKEIWIVHECGSFPNYTHGPNNMNFLAVNFSKKLYPVVWDKEYKNAKAKEAAAKRAANVVRDSRGRFAKRQLCSATPSQRILF